MSASILIVDDEKHTREGLSMVLMDKYDVSLARDADEAISLMDNKEFNIVLTDLRMAGKSGLRVIDYAIKKPYNPICIMMTAYGNIEAAVEAMKRGAYDFLTKPVNLEKLEIIIERALKERKLADENAHLHVRLDQKYSFTGVIGDSTSFISVLDKVKQVAPTKATILLTGETGTGKELIAQMIHQNSPRARAPFIAVHCSAIPAALLESELFGHEKGSFTGAHERRIGRFEAAHEGTIFLDEIGEIDAATQIKLLRFLETRSFERVGSNIPITVDVRVICATHRDLFSMVKAGTFREDLYYRLNVIPIHLPPLRERADDIPTLLDHYLKYFSRENGIPTPKLSKEALQVLMQYRWPGNIRELKNFCENMVVLHPGHDISKYDLNTHFNESDRSDIARPPTSSHLTTSSRKIAKPSLSKEENEKQLIHDALIESNGNRTKAAELLGISRRTLHRKLLEWPELDYKPSV